MQKLRFCLIILCLSVSAGSFAQTLRYNIKLKGDSIGTFTVKRLIQGNKISYSIDSKTYVKKLIDINILYSVESVFENGKLIRSVSKQTTNERVSNNTKTTWEGNVYVVQNADGKRNLREKVIDYNLATLYFIEPSGRTRIWSDAYGDFLPLKALGNHRYLLSMPDGKKNYYTYVSGICSMVETEQFFAKVSFFLTSN